MNDLVHNERARFSAAALDRISTACIAIGVIAPIVAFTSGTPGYSFGWSLTGFSAGWLFVGAALHFTGRAMLRCLRS
jgi:hypothetical protein